MSLTPSAPTETLEAVTTPNPETDTTKEQVSAKTAADVSTVLKEGPVPRTSTPTPKKDAAPVAPEPATAKTNMPTLLEGWQKKLGMLFPKMSPKDPEDLNPFRKAKTELVPSVRSNFAKITGATAAFSIDIALPKFKTKAEQTQYLQYLKKAEKVALTEFDEQDEANTLRLKKPVKVKPLMHKFLEKIGFRRKAKRAVRTATGAAIGAGIGVGASWGIVKALKSLVNISAPVDSFMGVKEAVAEAFNSFTGTILDATGTVFITVMTLYGAYKGAKFFMAWLDRIRQNKATDHQLDLQESYDGNAELFRFDIQELFAQEKAVAQAATVQ